MKKWISLGLILALCFSLGACAFGGNSQNLMEETTSSHSTSSEVPTVDSAPLNGEAFAEKQLNFSLQLFQKTVADGGAENRLISPLSVSLALSMATCGAAGETQRQMLQTLCGGAELDGWNQSLSLYSKSLTASKSAKVAIANSVWFRDEKVSVNPKFLQNAADYYGAAAYKSPFDAGTVKDINRWVKTNTDGMIDNIIEKIDPNIMLYLINALAFEADWNKVYKKNQVVDGIFTTASGVRQEAEMMRDTLYSYLETDGATGFIKDYKDGFRFVALLPDEGTSVEDFVAELTVQSLSETLNNVQNTKVLTRLPKFSYDDSLEMSDVLASMGMKDAFHWRLANFSEMGIMEGDGNLWLGKVLHKTHIEVGEQGTKAAAITAIEVPGDTAMPPQQEPKTVYLDRPFFFMILDGTQNLPLFIGIVHSVE